MPIVSSAVIDDRAQRDGRRAVREQHVDDQAVVYTVDYLAEQGADTAAPLAARAVQLAADLAAAELAANVQAAYAQGAATFRWATVAAFRTAVRQAFQTATAWDAARLGKYISGLGLTDNQYQTIFGVSAGAQLTALKARIATLAGHYDSVIADQGQ